MLFIKLISEVVSQSMQSSPSVARLVESDQVARVDQSYGHEKIELADVIHFSEAELLFNLENIGAKFKSMDFQNLAALF